MEELNLKNRSIFRSDNIEVLENINNDCIDLIYLDPPFNKNKIFTAPIGSQAEGAEFSDIFREEDVKDDWVQTIKEDNEKLHNFLNGIKSIDGRQSYNYCYLCYMAIRLIEMHRILKDTGSLYLHCDPTMSHSLKIVLDCIFGGDKFINELIWKKTNSPKSQSKAFGEQHDIIFLYAKDKNFLFSKIYKKLDENAIKVYSHKDDKGKFQTVALIAGGLQNYSGRKQFEFKGLTKPWLCSLKTLNNLWDKGLIHTTRNGIYRKKIYLNEVKGSLVSDLFVDSEVKPLQGKSKEMTGFPTQKPLALLERIIKASSNEGDLVLDPFCGCATTCVAAEKLGRKWIGIDVSYKAYELVKTRLNDEIPSELWDDKKINYFSSSNLKRTDGGGKYKEKKYVYILKKESELPFYKVGIAKDIKKRLSSYQTADKDRDYSMEYFFKTTVGKARIIEKYIHNKFENLHEWVKAKKENIIKEIELYEAQLITEFGEGATDSKTDFEILSLLASLNPKGVKIVTNLAKKKGAKKVLESTSLIKQIKAKYNK